MSAAKCDRLVASLSAEFLGHNRERLLAAEGRKKEQDAD
jgi:hypothetical protein